MSKPVQVAGTALKEPGGFMVSATTFEPSGVLLTVSGELDIATAPLLRERLSATIGGGVRRLVVDLCPVSFMDSIAVAAILHARKDLGEGGRMAVVTTAESYPRLVFEIAGLPACLDMFETTDAAIAHVGA
jgi:anti-sigma B factor antagonist